MLAKRITNINVNSILCKVQRPIFQYRNTFSSMKMLLILSNVSFMNVKDMSC